MKAQCAVFGARLIHVILWMGLYLVPLPVARTGSDGVCGRRKAYNRAKVNSAKEHTAFVVQMVYFTRGTCRSFVFFVFLPFFVLFVYLWNERLFS